MFGRHATGDEIGMHKMGKFYKEEKDMRKKIRLLTLAVLTLAERFVFSQISLMEYTLHMKIYVITVSKILRWKTLNVLHFSAKK